MTLILVLVVLFCSSNECSTIILFVMSHACFVLILYHNLVISHILYKHNHDVYEFFVH